MSDNEAMLADRLKRRFAGPMSALEIDFLRDAQAFIEFAIRNGLNFPVVVANLGHDFNSLSREGFDLDEAKKKGFLPKVGGYSRITSDDFGDLENPPG